jgi:hypothetical protein
VRSKISVARGVAVSLPTLCCHYTVCVARSRWPARLQCLSTHSLLSRSALCRPLFTFILAPGGPRGCSVSLPTLCCPDPPSAALYSPLFLPLARPCPALGLAPGSGTQVRHPASAGLCSWSSRGSPASLPPFLARAAAANVPGCQHKPRCHSYTLTHKQIPKPGFAPKDSCALHSASSALGTIGAISPNIDPVPAVPGPTPAAFWG